MLQQLLEAKNPLVQANKAGPTRPHSFPWWGGKYRLAPEIVKHLPEHRIYVEVFGGAASVLLAKPPSRIEVYNDKDGRLVNLFEVVRNQPVEFLQHAQHLLYSRQLFEHWKRYIWTAPWPERFTVVRGDKVELAVMTYYTIVSGFVGDPTKGWAFEKQHRHGGADRWASISSRIAPLSERFRHVAIDHLDFRDCIKNWDSLETLFYCDPPYVKMTQTGVYRFSWEHHLELCELLHKIQGRFLLSYDDVPQIRSLYTDCSILEIKAPLMSKKLNRGERRRSLRQILIANYNLEG